MPDVVALPAYDHVPADHWVTIARRPRDSRNLYAWQRVEKPILSMHDALLLDEHGKIFAMQRHGSEWVFLQVRRRLQPSQHQPVPAATLYRHLGLPPAGRMVSRLYSHYA